MSAHAATHPGTVASCTPCSPKPCGNAPASAIAGAAPEPLYAVTARARASYTSAKTSPPMAVRCGRTTAHTAAAAIAASTADPPSRSAASPATVARWWPLATMPFAARTVGRCVIAVMLGGRAEDELDREPPSERRERGDGDAEGQRVAGTLDHRHERERERDEQQLRRVGEKEPGEQDVSDGDPAQHRRPVRRDHERRDSGRRGRAPEHHVDARIAESTCLHVGEHGHRGRVER